MQGYDLPATAAQGNRALMTKTLQAGGEPIERTAAQFALEATEQTKASAQQLYQRLSGICANLACSIPPTDSQNKPRPVRGGIIGSIHECTDDLAAVLANCHELMNNIERQV